MADFTHSNGHWTLSWEFIGEGYNEDYDPDDGLDQPLLRVYLYKDGELVEDGSYCTQVPDGTPSDVLVALSEDLFMSLGENFERRVMEDWTWRAKP